VAKPWRIPVENLKSHLDEAIERVVEEDEMVIVDLTDGRSITISAGESDDSVRPNVGPMSPEAYEVFFSAAGGWSDVDTDALVERIYAERKSSKPVEL
jgi:hypothetical protein